MTARAVCGPWARGAGWVEAEALAAVRVPSVKTAADTRTIRVRIRPGRSRPERFMSIPFPFRDVLYVMGGQSLTRPERQNMSNYRYTQLPRS